MLAVNNPKVRCNIDLEKSQVDFLKTVKKETCKSVSEIIRELIIDYEKRERKAILRSAAQSLIDEYKTNNELTAFTALDGEKFR